MGLFGSKAKQVIEVSVEPSEAKPGDTVSVRVHVAGPPDEKARGVAAELVAKHHWASESTDEDNNVVVRWHDDVQVVAHSDLVPQGQALTEGDHVLSFTVPGDAMPSTAATLGWAARVVVHHRLGSHETDAPLTVVSEADPFANVATSPPTLLHDPAFHVEVDRRDVHPGDKVTGKVVLAPTSDVHLKALSVVLQLVRSDARDFSAKAGDRHTSISSPSKPVELARDLSLPAGATQTYPFELAVPADAVRTTRTLHTHMTWMVSAVGETKMLKANQLVHVVLHVH